MDDRNFDNLARAVGRGASRRSVLKGLLGLGSAAATAQLAADDTGAQFCPFSRRCNGQCCPSGQNCCNGACCPTGKCNTRPNPDICCTAGDVCHYGCCSGTTPKCCGTTCCATTDQCLSGGGCCAAGNTPCGPDCCAPGERCCDNECCNGVCYGEELCCPTPQVFCEATGECCPLGEVCCDDGCCAGTCVGGGAFGDSFCCPTGGIPCLGDSGAFCCLGETPDCCDLSDGSNFCIPAGGCCEDADCQDSCLTCDPTTHTCLPIPDCCPPFTTSCFGECCIDQIEVCDGLVQACVCAPGFHTCGDQGTCNECCEDDDCNNPPDSCSTGFCVDLLGTGFCEYASTCNPLLGSCCFGECCVNQIEVCDGLVQACVCAPGFHTCGSQGICSQCCEDDDCNNPPDACSFGQCINIINGGGICNYVSNCFGFCCPDGSCCQDGTDDCCPI